METTRHNTKKRKPSTTGVRLCSVRSIASLVIASCLTIFVQSSNATTLGGIVSPTLSAYSSAGSSGAPTVLAYENFTGSNGSSLNNTLTDGGGYTWVQKNGTWTVTSNQADSNNNSNSFLFVNSTLSSGSVEVVLSRNGATTFDSGGVINATSDAKDALTVSWLSSSNGTIAIWKRVNSAWTQLASVTNLYPGGIATAPTSVTVRLESPSNSQMKAYLNGVLVISHTLSAGDQTTFKNATHTWAGFYADSSGTVTFDNWHLDA